MDRDEVLLADGEKDIESLFEMLKEKLPMPDEHVKDAVLGAFTYVLSM